jgi:hypothetical protein
MLSQSETATRATSRKSGKVDMRVLSKNERSKIGI